MEEKKETVSEEKEKGFFSAEAMEERIQAFLQVEKAKRPTKIATHASLAD